MRRAVSAFHWTHITFLEYGVLETNEYSLDHWSSGLHSTTKFPILTQTKFLREAVVWFIELTYTDVHVILTLRLAMIKSIALTGSTWWWLLQTSAIHSLWIFRVYDEATWCQQQVRPPNLSAISKRNSVPTKSPNLMLMIRKLLYRTPCVHISYHSWRPSTQSCF